MNPPTTVIDILLRYESLWEQGEKPNPEDLCRDHPELRPRRARRRATAEGREVPFSVCLAGLIKAPKKKTQRYLDCLRSTATRWLGSWAGAAWGWCTRPARSN